ncbi:hypothetical protein JJD41_11115 [Oxynema sp. CENA135]|uniref:hypothetical protein n=1 Tax=Oxynema sp. CENA135 TaxID=984206 RepID=UPI001909B3B6|nr:hypothetical protein [Oxynema sp. CENA135]MBK4730407.1 hypothetical protein [Oxynema sp. CENA135]
MEIRLFKSDRSPPVNSAIAGAELTDRGDFNEVLPISRSFLLKNPPAIPRRRSRGKFTEHLTPEIVGEYR